LLERECHRNCSVCSVVHQSVVLDPESFRWKDVLFDCMYEAMLVVTFTNTKHAVVCAFVNFPYLVNTFTFVRISDLQNESYKMSSWRFTNVQFKVVDQ